MRAVADPTAFILAHSLFFSLSVPSSSSFTSFFFFLSLLSLLFFLFSSFFLSLFSVPLARKRAIFFREGRGFAGQTLGNDQKRQVTAVDLVDSRYTFSASPRGGESVTPPWGEAVARFLENGQQRKISHP